MTKRNECRLAQTMRAKLSGFYTQVTPRGSYVLLLLGTVLLVGLASGEEVFFRVGYALGLALVVSYAWTKLNLWRLDMRILDQSAVARVGDVLEVSVSVRNGLPLPTSLLEIVHVSDLPGHVCGRAIRIPASGCKKWTTRSSCHTRGIYTIGPLVARSSDPLGLFSIMRTQGDCIKVAIYPPVVELPHFRLPIAVLSGGEVLFYSPQTRSSHAVAVREYSPGDRLNRIHWPSTARHERLMSKEFDSWVCGDVWIILDLDKNVQASMGTEKADEYAVAAAASLANVALKCERSTGLLVYGEECHLLPPGRGIEQFSSILETLTQSKTVGDVALVDVLSQHAVGFGKLASLLVITSSAATEWVPVLQSLVCRGLSIVVLLVDPTSFGGAHSCSEVLIKLLSAGIPAYLARKDDDLASVLSRGACLHGLFVAEQCGVSGAVQVSEQ